MNNHEIDYKLFGDDMQYVQVELDPQETVVAEAGALMMMDDSIHMETIFWRWFKRRLTKWSYGEIIRGW
ncbi:AIM24 family protein [Lysinibacillus sp. MHQ-1]|nr:AIM24 family protein [Lysinibacillus sp. MHQ-1]